MLVEFLVSHWGGVSSVVGMIVSVAGIGWAIKEARGAHSASQAAKTAANATRDRVARRLRATDFERAVGVVNRLKLLHSIERWEAAIEQYQTLRTMINDILSYHLQSDTEHTQTLTTARLLVSRMETYVEIRIDNGLDARDRAVLGRRLAAVQSALEDTATNGVLDY
jgi:hypothetical protein